MPDQTQRFWPAKYKYFLDALKATGEDSEADERRLWK